MSKEEKNGVNMQGEKTESRKQIILEWVRDIAIAIVIALALSE